MPARKNVTDTKTIAVYGLGNVRTGCAPVLASLRHRIFGVDLNSSSTDGCNAERSPTIEAGPEDIDWHGVERGRLVATTLGSDTIAAADIPKICVGIL